ncbi:hypothetical protein [Streptomyces sp. IBSBF 2806]|uniref:hypothetical protein n=1 Tax=Streptomyces sp. IBSBF 2806 TaxID=2903529 RepID=UPI002FDC1A22
MTNQQSATAVGTPAGGAHWAQREEAPATTLAEFRAPWLQLREAVQQILGDQPTNHLVHATARRIAAEVHLTADAVAKELETREARR